MQKKWIMLAIFLGISFAGVLTAQENRAIHVVSNKNSDGSIFSAVGGNEVNLGVYHALLIGINKYEHPELAPNLVTPLNDIYNIRDLLIRHYGFENENVRLLSDSQATRKEIFKALTFYRDAPLGSSDNLLIYYAGHGFRHPNTEDGFWIPSDATREESTWVPVSEIRRIIKNIRAKHTLLISDSCFSGTLTRATVTLPTNERFLTEVANKDSYQVLTSGGLEPVADGGRDGMSLFAYSLYSYLKNPPNLYFTTTQLYADIAPIVSNASGSLQTPEHGKIPGTFDQNGQFIFTRVDMIDDMPPVPESPPSPTTVDTVKPIGTLSPIPTTSLPNNKATFHNISYSPPSGWEVTINMPGKEMEYEDPVSDSTISISINELSNPSRLTVEPESTLKKFSESAMSSWKEKGFKKVKLINKEQKTQGNLHLLFWDVSAEYGRLELWIRAIYIVDSEGERLYTCSITAYPEENESVLKDIEQFMSTIQRTYN